METQTEQHPNGSESISIISISKEENFRQEIRNWFLLNKEFKFLFSYIRSLVHFLILERQKEKEGKNSKII